MKKLFLKKFICVLISFFTIFSFEYSKNLNELPTEINAKKNSNTVYAENSNLPSESVEILNFLTSGTPHRDITVEEDYFEFKDKDNKTIKKKISEAFLYIKGYTNELGLSFLGKNKSENPIFLVLENSSFKQLPTYPPTFAISSDVNLIVVVRGKNLFNFLTMDQPFIRIGENSTEEGEGSVSFIGEENSSILMISKDEDLIYSNNFPCISTNVNFDVNAKLIIGGNLYIDFECFNKGKFDVCGIGQKYNSEKKCKFDFVVKDAATVRFMQDKGHVLGVRKDDSKNSCFNITLKDNSNLFLQSDDCGEEIINLSGKNYQENQGTFIAHNNSFLILDCIESGKTNPVFKKDRSSFIFEDSSSIFYTTKVNAERILSISDKDTGKPLYPLYVPKKISLNPLEDTDVISLTLENGQVKKTRILNTQSLAAHLPDNPFPEDFATVLWVPTDEYKDITVSNTVAKATVAPNIYFFKDSFNSNPKVNIVIKDFEKLTITNAADFSSWINTTSPIVRGIGDPDCNIYIYKYAPLQNYAETEIKQTGEGKWETTPPEMKENGYQTYVISEYRSYFGEEKYKGRIIHIIDQVKYEIETRQNFKTFDKTVFNFIKNILINEYKQDYSDNTVAELLNKIKNLIKDNYTDIDQIIVDEIIKILSFNLSENKVNPNDTKPTLYTVDSIVIELDVDTKGPEGEIKIDKNTWSKFLNIITLGFFGFKNEISVTISAKDNLSGVKKIEYAISNEQFEDEQSLINKYKGEWKSNNLSGDSIIINPEEDSSNNWDPELLNKSYFIYARITDNAKNVLYISSDKLIAYKDSDVEVGGIIINEGSSTDKNVVFNLRGNSIVKVVNASLVKQDSLGEELSKDTDYVFEKNNSTVVFKGDYLKKLQKGEYSIYVYSDLPTENNLEENLTLSHKITVLVIKRADLIITNGNDFSNWINKTPIIKGRGEANFNVRIRKEEGSSDYKELKINEDGTFETTFDDIEDGKDQILYIEQYDENDESNSKTSLKLSIDRSAPIGKIEVKNNPFTEFLRESLKNLNFKNKISVKVSATDNLSGVKSIDYIKTNKQYFDVSNLLNETQDQWTTDQTNVEKTDEGSALMFDIDPTSDSTNWDPEFLNKSYFVYAKITDMAGNISFVSSDGLIAYTDSESSVEEFAINEGSSEDISANFKLRGNSVTKVEVKSKELNKELIKETEYETNKSSSTVIFKGSFLKNLKKGGYEIYVYSDLESDIEENLSLYQKLLIKVNKNSSEKDSDEEKEFDRNDVNFNENDNIYYEDNSDAIFVDNFNNDVSADLNADDIYVIEKVVNKMKGYVLKLDEDYTIDNNNQVILTKEYLSSLENGEHDFDVYYKALNSDDTKIVTFKIVISNSFADNIATRIVVEKMDPGTAEYNNIFNIYNNSVGFSELKDLSVYKVSLVDSLNNLIDPKATEIGYVNFAIEMPVSFKNSSFKAAVLNLNKNFEGTIEEMNDVSFLRIKLKNQNSLYGIAAVG
ncbi:MAG: hypothetical protein LBT82_01575 [Oscillospiraceae bacterium]|jgi:hypothetical protein|nr:hypothetical protein [Oscillospiraceae bacterium]